MSRTIYTHKNCGGNIAGQLLGFKLISPFIGVGYSRLSLTNYQFLTEDLKTPKGDKLVQVQYLCVKCQQDITDVANEIVAECVVCHNLHPIKELFATDYTPILCKDCSEQLRGDDAEKILEVIDDPKKRIKKTPLFEILTAGIKI